MTEPPRARPARAPDPARLVAEALDAIVAWDLTGTITWWNKGAEALYGYTSDEAVGRVFHELLDTRFPTSFAACVDALRSEGRWQGELRHVRKDGREVQVETGWSAVVDAAAGTHVLEVSRDMAARTFAEEALRGSRQFFQQIIQSTQEGIAVFDRNLRYVIFNPYMERLTGLAARDVVGAHPAEVFPWFAGDPLRGILERARAGEHIHRDDVQIAVSRSNQPRWITDDHNPLTVNGEIVGVIATVRDVTERRSLEAQFRQAQKMEAVGQLAGGVAHDFNNLLTAILGYAKFLEEDVPRSEQRRDAQEIIRAAERAALLTKQLLAFSRRQVVETTLVDLNALIVDLANMLGRLIGEQISMTTSLGSALSAVRADRSQLEQVLMNLVVNARDAMPEGGTIRIETSTVVLDEMYATGHVAVKPGGYVMLAVSDSGVGMTEEVKARIFEPFFTTKGRDKGTGLGLSTVYGLVSQAGGYIWVYSEVGRGTTFKVYLPAVDEAAAAATPPVPPPQRTRGGQETVLLVEDEEAVRLLARIILERAGYRVLEAPDPEAAIVAFDQASGAVDLLVSDVIMPGGTGPELLQRLAARQPSLRALMMSGYTGNSAIDRRQIEATAAFLEKPFTADGLRRKVREVLDR